MKPTMKKQLLERSYRFISEKLESVSYTTPMPGQINVIEMFSLAREKTIYFVPNILVV